MQRRFLQSGQTLIETMVAVLILSVGIGSAIGLASYALNATKGVTKQLIGVGLAREGIEAVKNMRDTNWLKTTLTTTCWDFYSQTSAANCYTNWLSGNGGTSYNINPGASQTYALGFDRTSSAYWNLIPTTGSFGLNYSSNTPDTGMYSPGLNGVTVANATSEFARKITLTTDSGFAPFDQDTGPRLKVTVDVWWQDKRCLPSADVPASGDCAIRMETYLTNWKNY